MNMFNVTKFISGKIKKTWVSLFVSGLAVIISCTKEIDLHTKDSPPQLIIQGVINDQGLCSVNISKSISLNDNIYPKVSNAEVTITDINTGITNDLIETSPGEYHVSGMDGRSGHTYQLAVTVEEKTYTAQSTMPPRVGLDRIDVKHVDVIDDLYAIVYFQDPAGVSNYYSFTQTIVPKIPWTGRQLSLVTIFSDRLDDGNYISQILLGRRGNNFDIKEEDVLTIEMSCIDKGAYTFYRTLSLGNNPASDVPSNPVGNFSNGALGVFSAQTSEKKTIQVKTL